ncbi:MAG: diacylglycerol kinase family protein [bacterium]
MEQQKPRRIKVVLNGKAGRRTGEQAKKLIDESFKSLDPNLTIDYAFTKAPRHATELAHQASEEGYNLVVASGGDGTVNEVVNGLVHTQTTMGIIPNGSGNVFAHEMKLPTDTLEACRMILSREPTEVDVAQVGDRFYIWLLGIGIEAKTAYMVNPTLKKYFGVLAYVVAALRNALDPGYSLMRMTADDKEMTFFTFNTIVGNAASFDGFLGIRSRHSITDGFLDVCILQKKTILGILELMFNFFKGRRDYYRFIDRWGAAHIRVKELRIETVPSAYYHVDGEVAGKTPIEVKLHHKAMKLILPPRS